LAPVKVRFGELFCVAEKMPPLVRGNAASAKAATAQVRFVRIAAIGPERSERPLPALHVDGAATAKMLRADAAHVRKWRTPSHHTQSLLQFPEFIPRLRVPGSS